MLIIFLCTTELIAQEGTPFITHYKECKEIETQNWSVSQDDHNIMFFANRRGIMSFDGVKWDMIKIPFIPFAIKKSPYDNKVYVGTNNNFGFLERNAKGFVEYKSLVSDSTDLGIISRIIFTDSTIFFYGEQTITRYFIQNPDMNKRWSAKNNKRFTGMFITNRNTFINVSGEGLYRLESDTLFPIVTGFYTENSEILFSLPYNNQKILVGTDNSELYTFDGIKYYNYDINDDGYLKESILADGQIISDSLYAFGTLYGGVEIVNKRTGKIVYTVNYQNGLPDDEIYSLGLDNNNGLWITHEFGISRVDFSLPLRNFSNYPGLKGNLISSLWHNNELYVATNEGVYYLSEVKDFNEIEFWVKSKPVKERVRTTSEKSSVSESTGSKKTDKRLFSRLFSKKESESIAPTEQKPTSKKSVKSTQTKPRYVKRTRSELKSINYIYKKIEGFDEKCTQLISTNQGILVASNNGLFHIEEKKVTTLVKNRYINQISKEINGNYFIGTNNGFFSVKYKEDNWHIIPELIDFTEPIYTINILPDSSTWLGSNEAVYSFSVDTSENLIELKKYKVKTDFPEQYRLDYVNDSLYLFLESGMFTYNSGVDSFIVSTNKSMVNDSRFLYLLPEQKFPWLKINNNWECINSEKVWTENEQSILKLFDDISSINSDIDNNLWIINNNRELYKINHANYIDHRPDFNVFFNDIKNEEGIHFELSDLIFKPENKAIYVRIIAPYYIKQNTTQYQYFVEGLMNKWSDWSANQNINLIVQSGNYNLHVRAKDIWGNKSELKSLQFKIEPPFSESIWFYVIIGIGILALFFTISKIRERKHSRDKKILEQKVKERTIEIQKQKEEIEGHRDKIIFQRDEILSQKEEITASINYASRIQNAVLPIKDHFEKSFNDHFILYNPRDIVSGDFYWIAEDKDKLYFTAADCTGHGVPGAFMSMLGISSLNEIFGSKSAKLTASKILNQLREKIKFSLHQTGKDGENKDGMDMAMCILHKNKNILEYAGAYNPLYLIRDGELQEYKADRMPIGIYHVEKEHFTNHEIKIKKEDTIYIFSDGYVDQFGGPGETKFKSVNLKKMLLEIHQKPMSEQKQILEDKFQQWKGELYQIDDIIFIGIKF